ncbi:M48 family metallopeptidase [uncultured Sphingomonas sp.]|uniref:M48 family metallopeptidase n=1 Tax=uncultured Sphingomonas sp. TaxID=158754 RepID=UPI0025E58820|nr:M48 family metallopeptidase [uncultured Sphingomonas sp.]
MQRRMPALVPSADGTHFTLDGDGAAPGPYAFADLDPEGHSHHERAFKLKGRPGWRITFLEFPPAEIAIRLPKPRRGHPWFSHARLVWAGATLVVLALLALGLTLKLPPLLARLIPQSTQQRMGRLMVANLGAYACSTPQGDAALKALATRLRQDDDVTIRVLRAPMINAAAFPGGEVVLFDGLVQGAESPDEIAGVLAHELGHVAHRDGMESLIRHYGLDLLFGGFERNVGGYTSALLHARHSYKAEAGADGYAIGRLQFAKVSPLPTAALLDRLGKQDADPASAGKLLTYVSSHPLSDSRERAFRASANPGVRYIPALTATQWQALRSMCGGAPGA